MSFQKIERKCKHCGCIDMEIVPTEYGTAIICTECYEVEKLNDIKTVSNNIPKCPTCNSTNLSKISTISKVGSVAMWGLLSQKVKKTWHCNSCEYEW